ncbi:prenyltransferase/squalene oxidase repeat-containing protein [Streptomyces sp. NPDC059063]|uniref:prenyltransferase/squalene oxidase repeat-containing protein n=1 Tax=unclassified Streptomyces TaxID=2593676 RepID=UPI003697EAA6
MRLSLRLRTAAGIPAAALATVLLPPGAAHAEPAAPAPEAAASAAPKSPANAAATWMASKLTDGSNAKGDHGLTADIVMGLAATGTGGATQKKATDWLEANAGAYINKGTPGAVFAGGTAKLALVAAIEHRDPRNFGGHDLVKILTGRLQENGRFTDELPGDGSNQFTQSLAVLALQRTGGLEAKAVDFLAKSRCADGGYPLSFKTGSECKSHTDSTGLAVQALLGAGRLDDAKRGLDWLQKQQLPDGSFRDNGFGTPPGNSNSTALDVQALAAGGRVEAAAKGVAWLRSRQVGCAAPEADRGAVGYDKPKADGMALRATAQVVPALTGTSLAQVDGQGAADALEPIRCDADGGTSGGGDNGGTDGGGSDGGTSGGSGGSGGGDGGASGGGDNGGGTSGGGDGGGDGGGSGSASGGSDGGDAGNSPAPQGGPGGSGTTGGGDVGGSGVQPVGNPGGSLASTGTTSLPFAGGAGVLVAVGAATVLATRRRRTS